MASIHPAAKGPERVRPEAAEEPPDFLAGIRKAFELAAETSPTGIQCVHFRFAGRPVRLRGAGPGLVEQLKRSFQPLEVEPGDGPVELTIDAWDRSHTGVGCPGVPFAPELNDPVGGGLLTQYGNGRVVRHEQPSSVAALDRLRREIFLCVDNAGEREVHTLSKPFPHLLAAWYQDRGIQQLHAALVSRAGRGVLFVGQGGRGKTTCAVTCALNGFDFLGDDNIGIELTGSSCVGHAFYNSVRVDESTLKRFPRLAHHSIAPVGRWESKSLVYMSDLVPHGMAARADVKAIVVPNLVGLGATRLAAAARLTALRHLAPSSLCVPLGGRGPGLAAMGELVRRLPCYTLDLGPDLEEVSTLIDRLTSAA